MNQAWVDTIGYSVEEVPTINDLVEQLYDDEESKSLEKERIYSLYKITKKTEGKTVYFF
jgi:hypothetical protein